MVAVDERELYEVKRFTTKDEEGCNYYISYKSDGMVEVDLFIKLIEEDGVTFVFKGRGRGDSEIKVFDNGTAEGMKYNLYRKRMGRKALDKLRKEGI